VGPVPGYDIRVLNKEGFEVPPGTLGDIVIKLPLPPGSLLDLYKVSLSRND
jgi:propionyl-CoA synthetase